MDQPLDYTTTTDTPPCKRFPSGWLCRVGCTDESHDEFLQDQN